MKNHLLRLFSSRQFMAVLLVAAFGVVLAPSSAAHADGYMLGTGNYYSSGYGYAPSAPRYQPAQVQYAASAYPVYSYSYNYPTYPVTNYYQPQPVRQYTYQQYQQPVYQNYMYYAPQYRNEQMEYRRW